MQTSFPIRSKVFMFLLLIMLLEVLITEVNTSSNGFASTRPAGAGNGVSFSPKRYGKRLLDKQRAHTPTTTEVPKTRDLALPRPFIGSERNFELEKLFGKLVYIDLRREANNDTVLPAVEVAKPSYPRSKNFIDLEDEATTPTPQRVTGGYTYIDLQSEKPSVSLSTDKSANKAYIDLDSESKTTTESNREVVYIDIEKVESTTTTTNEANVYIDLQAERNSPTTLPPPSVATTSGIIFYIDLQPDTDDNRDPNSGSNVENTIMTTPGNNQSLMRVVGPSGRSSAKSIVLPPTSINSTTVGNHGGNRVYINIAGDEYDDLGGRSDNTFSPQKDTLQNATENGAIQTEDTTITTPLSTTTNSSSLDLTSTSTTHLPEMTTTTPLDNVTVAIPSPIDTTTAITSPNETTTRIPPPNETTTGIPSPNETTIASPSPTPPEQITATKNSDEPTTTEENLPVVEYVDDPKFAGNPTMNFMDDYELYRKRGCVGFSCNEF